MLSDEQMSILDRLDVLVVAMRYAPHDLAILIAFRLQSMFSLLLWTFSHNPPA
jgi:hypothetical protein